MNNFVKPILEHIQKFATIDCIRTDNGTEFVELHRLAGKLGIQSQLTAADDNKKMGHSSLKGASLGLLERFYRTLREALQTTATAAQIPTEMEHYLVPFCVHKYNHWPHSSTGTAPTSHLYGITPGNLFKTAFDVLIPGQSVWCNHKLYKVLGVLNSGSVALLASTGKVFRRHPNECITFKAGDCFIPTTHTWPMKGMMTTPTWMRE